MVSHKDILGTFMKPIDITNNIKDKRPFIIHRHTESTGLIRRIIVCLKCKKGDSGYQHFNITNWIFNHTKKCKCEWEKYESYFNDALAPNEDPICDMVSATEVDDLKAKIATLEGNTESKRIKELEEELSETKDDAKHYEEDSIEAQKQSTRLDNELYRLQERILYLPDHILNLESVQDIIKDIRTARAEKKSEKRIVRSAETPSLPKPPPMAPKLTVQNVAITPEPRNEIHNENESYKSDTPDVDSVSLYISPVESIVAPPTKKTIRKLTTVKPTLQIDEPPRNQIEYDWDDNGSTVSCEPMENWDMEDENVSRLFYTLSDILEQGMPYKVAKKNYLELLLELRPLQEQIGRPFRVLQAYLRDEYTLKELDNFLTLYE